MKTFKSAEKMLHDFIAKCFAKGAEKEKASKFAEAFSYYEAANRAKFSTLTWDDAIEQELFDAILETFTKEFIDKMALSKECEITPVFIVGMPRSGSTLIEQILDMHPGIAGAGETPYLVQSILEQFQEPNIYPEDLEVIGKARLWKIRTAYLRKLASHVNDKKMVCDKMLVNFHHVGLIAILFPNAKIIHSRRNEVDCKLACYAKNFNKENLPFSYDLKALECYYRRYAALMKRWDEVLPGRVRAVDYESMVTNQRGEVGTLLNYIGVPWDENCMRFYENSREVKTASREQVNKPLYATSLGRGEPFADLMWRAGS